MHREKYPQITHKADQEIEDRHCWVMAPGIVSGPGLCLPGVVGS